MTMYVQTIFLASPTQNLIDFVFRLSRINEANSSTTSRTRTTMPFPYHTLIIKAIQARKTPTKLRKNLQATGNSPVNFSACDASDVSRKSVTQNDLSFSLFLHNILLLFFLLNEKLIVCIILFCCGAVRRVVTMKFNQTQIFG